MTSHGSARATFAVGSILHEPAPGGPRPKAPAMPAIGTLFRNRWLDAFAKALVCFALTHQVMLLVDSVTHHRFTGWNVFTMIEAQRLVPSLADGAGSRWLSLGFGLLVYALVFALATRRAVATPERPQVVRAAGWVTDTGFHLARPVAHLRRPTLAHGVLAFVAGLAAHMAALSLVERFVPEFPGIPDVVQARLPLVQFGWPGELCFALFLATFAVIFLRSQRRAVPALLVMLGAFYGLRGVFLFLLPIGMPPTALPLAERFTLYPYPAHAYFPGGHMGLMTIMSLSLRDLRWRRAFMAATCVFAFGTILARAHYTADALGGWLLGYAVIAWGRRHLGPRAELVRRPGRAVRPIRP
jgi:hypothetical protein